jgi:hypothetical protein
MIYIIIALKSERKLLQDKMLMIVKKIHRI